jgi:hypothetical protein
MGILGEYLYQALKSGVFKNLGTPAFEKFYALLDMCTTILPSLVDFDVYLPTV